MPKPLIRETEEKELRRIQSFLTNTAKKSKTVSVSKKDATSLAKLINSILDTQPIVIETYLTPNEAAKLAGISRPVIIEMLKSGTLTGHTVGNHWRIKRESLVEYIESRDSAFRTVTSQDQDGFGLD